VAESDLIGLLAEMKESLRREIRRGFADMHEGFAKLNARFDAQEQRLDRMLPCCKPGTDEDLEWPMRSRK
jgi:hypothetical protein